MIKSKKQMFIIIGAFILVMMLTTVTYAFFNYTRTGVSNTIRVGRISFVTRQNGNISLTNIFPISSSEATGENTNYDEVEIEIVGDTDYTGGIEYVVTATNVNMTVGNKEIPITLDINVDGLLGTEDEDYYTNRENYSTNKYKLEYDGSIGEDSHILVGYIAPNTTGNIDGINGTINIKAYLDKDKIKISDTYDGNETNNMGTTNEWVGSSVVLTTNEWNSLQNSGLSFKVRVEANEGIWVEDPQILREIIANNVSANYIVSYDDVIRNNPTFTTQDQVSTNDTKKTVYYYYGYAAPENANVLFAGYCWQIIRTTDDGGVRMLYNGVAKKDVSLTTDPLSDTDITYTNDTNYPYTYDSTTKKWTSTNHTDSTIGKFIFTVKEAGDYAINYNVSSEKNYDKAKFYINNSLVKEDSGTITGQIDLGTLATTDEIKVEYTKDSSGSSGNDNVIFEIAKVTNRVESDIPVCRPDRKTTKGVFQAHSSSYTVMEDATIFGRSYDYDLDTGIFTLEDSEGLPTIWTFDDNNNNNTPDYQELTGTYTCLSNSNTCSTLYYVADYRDDTRAYISEYTIGMLPTYSVMGKSAFNSSEYSVPFNGYMFNKTYPEHFNNSYYSGEKFATATWDSVNSEYVLSDGNGTTSADETHRYQRYCSAYGSSQTNGEDECYNYDDTKVLYITYGRYIKLENGELIEDALYKMIGYGSEEVKTRNSNYQLNKYNSAIKGYLDNWYKKNLTAYTNYLDENAVYCNDRSIADQGLWGQHSSYGLLFNQHNINSNLNCVNETDRFAVSNPKAKLTYPIGLLSIPERELVGADLTKIDVGDYWTISPDYTNGSYNRVIYGQGNTSSSNVVNAEGVRGVITLKPGSRIEDGTGTYTDPYIVGPIVTRDN